MALARITTWSSGQVLTASALNGEINNILNNPISLISPLTYHLDLGGYLLQVSGVSKADFGNSASTVGLVPPPVSGTPNQHALFRESVPKGWATIAVSAGTPTLANSFNVSGITDTAQGQVTVTWDRDFADGDYALSVLTAGGGVKHVSVESQVVGSIVCDAYAADHTSLADPSRWYVMAIGDQ